MPALIASPAAKMLRAKLSPDFLSQTFWLFAFPFGLQERKRHTTTFSRAPTLFDKTCGSFLFLPQYSNTFRRPKSIRYQQPVDGSKSKALLANKGCGVEFSTILRISSGKSDVDDLPRPRMRTDNGSMLLASHFTLPIAAETSVASNGIEEWAAPADRSVAKHHYMPIMGLHAIQKFRTGQIESVPNHDCCPAHVPEIIADFGLACRRAQAAHQRPGRFSQGGSPCWPRDQPNGVDGSVVRLL